jgi:hypothetical protein
MGTIFTQQDTYPPRGAVLGPQQLVTSPQSPLPLGRSPIDALVRRIAIAMTSFSLPMNPRRRIHDKTDWTVSTSYRRLFSAVAPRLRKYREHTL